MLERLTFFLEISLKWKFSLLWFNSLVEALIFKRHNFSSLISRTKFHENRTGSSGYMNYPWMFLIFPMGGLT